uniref:Peptidase M12B domain-containing protein n=1 Tax=Romanomermis culicivorax TaxID=13658 RepID=A0A915JT70_ROMCU
MYLELLFISVYFLSQSVSHDFDSIQSVEVLGPNSVNKRVVKRSISFPVTVEYSFYAFSKEFRLLLKNKGGLLSPEFEAVTFEEDNKNGESIIVDVNDFYEGSTFGDAYSDVKAYVDENGMLTATIKTKNDIYIIEPAWRHLNDAEYGSSIVYKYNVTYPTRNQNFMNNNSEKIVKRAKRSYNFSRNRCPLKLVADYLFYKNIGGSSASATVKYLIALIDRVNSIFLETSWQDFEGDTKAIQNMGFVIKKIEIYKNFSQNPLHYNTDTISDIGKLLHVFSVLEGTDFNKFCLVHLFTYRAFMSGVLGLGYIAQPGIGSPGGMCCAASIEADKLVYYNTAISSLRSTYGKTVVTREADLVTAHVPSFSDWKSEPKVLLIYIYLKSEKHVRRGLSGHFCTLQIHAREKSQV